MIVESLSVNAHSEFEQSLHFEESLSLVPISACEVLGCIREHAKLQVVNVLFHQTYFIPPISLTLPLHHLVHLHHPSLSWLEEGILVLMGVRLG
jgi:hypothetical protein